MEELGLNIRHLLKINSKIYLPGIGTFKKERIAAFFDENTNSFFPPTFKIILDAEKGSPELITEYISTIKQISTEESDQHLKSIIGSILLLLNEQGECEIPSLGKVFQNDGELTFIEDENTKNDSTLQSVQERKLIAPTPIEKIKEEILVDGEANESNIQEDDNYPDKDLKETLNEQILFGEEEFEPKGRAINWLWPALIILFLIGAGAYWYFMPLNDKSVAVSINEIATQPYVSPSKDPSLSDTISNQSADSLHSSVSDSVNNLQDTTSSVIENTGKIHTSAQKKVSYEIIIVSFGKFAEAEQYVQTMERRGIDVEILKNKRPGNLLKISAGSFDSEKEAQIELNKVRENLSKDAWIYKMKP